MNTKLREALTCWVYKQKNPPKNHIAETKEVAECTYCPNSNICREFKMEVKNE